MAREAGLSGVPMYISDAKRDLFYDKRDLLDGQGGGPLRSAHI